METTLEVIPEKEIEQGIVSLSDNALSLKVVDNVTYSQAGEILLLHKDMQKKITAYFAPLKQAAHHAWKTICNREAEELDKLTPAEKHLKGEIAQFQAEEEAKRKAEEARLAEIARQQEEDRRLNEALQAEKEGNKEEAAAIMEEEVFIPPPVVEKTVPKVSGIVTKTVWKYEIVDESKLPRQYLIPNERAIKGAVEDLKTKCNIPGVKIWREQTIAAGRR